MLYGAQIQAMMPKLHSTNFPGMELIRPLYCVHVDQIIAWKTTTVWNFIQCACRFTENCPVNEMKPASRNERSEAVVKAAEDRESSGGKAYFSEYSLCKTGYFN
jgi:hypothetical protein